MSVPSEELSLVERYLAADPAALAAAAADWRDGAERLRRAYDAVADALPLVREGAGHSRTGRRAGEALHAADPADPALDRDRVAARCIGRRHLPRLADLALVAADLREDRIDRVRHAGDHEGTNCQG